MLFSDTEPEAKTPHIIVPQPKRSMLLQPTEYYNVEEHPAEYVSKGMIPKNILDPFSVIIKLAILSKKKVGCKLCILNHVLYIQEPGIFQPFVRYMYNTTKEDLCFLYNPIEIACSHFIIFQPKDNVPSILIMAQKGLLNLIEQYQKHPMVVHTLFMYYNVIMNYVGEQYNNAFFMKDAYTEEYQKEYIEVLNSKWTDNRVKMVYDMLQYIDSEEGSGDVQNIKYLEEFMANIDRETVEFFTQLDMKTERESA
jgi:hypothetical protein